MSLPSRNFRNEQLPSPLPEWRVPLCEPHFTDADVQAAVNVLRSGWWTCGPVTRALESEFAGYVGVPHALAVSSGTAALHLAFKALGLGPGDEVLTPSLTFVAAANCIVHAGGVPRFVDVDSFEQPLTAPEALERAITPRTRGICVMHYGGYPCSMNAVIETARRHHLWVVEDSAHAPGAKSDGKRCGAWGDAGCFSFFGNKNLTCGEGGMITTASDELAQKIKHLRSHGMSSLTWDRYQGHQFSYDVLEAGFNYRMDDLRAAILRVQLDALDESNRRRAQRVAWYRALMDSDPRWLAPFAHHAGEASFHLFPVVLAAHVDRAHVMAELKARGVQSSVHYPPVHQFSYYRRLGPPPASLEVTETLGRRLLTLPLYPDMTRGQVEWVVGCLREAAK